MQRTFKVQNIETALRLYYEMPELSGEDIKTLFGGISNSTVTNLKKPVRARMKELGLFCPTRYAVNTKVAYEIWGIDVKDLEIRYKKHKALFG